jgi:hypothetical protein
MNGCTPPANMAPPAPVPLMAINAVPVPAPGPGPSAAQQFWRQTGPRTYVTMSGGQRPGGVSNENERRPVADAATPSKIARLEGTPSTSGE